MVTVIISTTNRPQMLRTALQSVAAQTAREQISRVIVSENAMGRDSAAVCAEFPSLPIDFIQRDPPLPALEHGMALYTHPDSISTPYVAILHDDDWWGIDHIANGLRELERDPEAVAYWSTSYLVHGESSWIVQCWNESCWIAAGFPPLNKVTKLTSKQVALACVGSGPAHYSTLVVGKAALAAAFTTVSQTGNLHDNDRLLFLELSRIGSLLVNFVPEVFVRQHPGQDQRSLTIEESSEHISAATRIVLSYCKEQGLEVESEFKKLHQECPIPTYRSNLLGTFDSRVVKELQRLKSLPLPHLFHKRGGPKWMIHQVCPPVVWRAASLIRKSVVGREL